MGKRKKLNYEIPRLVMLDGAAANGTGQCQNGSAASNCTSGNAATAHSCSTGSGASCTNGNLYTAAALFKLFKR